MAVGSHLAVSLAFVAPLSKKVGIFLLTAERRSGIPWHGMPDSWLRGAQEGWMGLKTRGTRDEAEVTRGGVREVPCALPGT